MDGRRLAILDQTRLPGAEVWLALEGAADTAQAIRRLAVRGARSSGSPPRTGWRWRSRRAARTRHVGVRLGAAARRAPDRGQPRVGRRPRRAAALAAGPAGEAAAARAEAEAIEAEQDARLGGHRRARRRRCWPARGGSSPTATRARSPPAARGRALAVDPRAARSAAPSQVLAGETRPLLQGARLTVWELARAGVPHELVVDGAAAGLIRRGEVDAVIVGADRVAANGDVANKVGTYSLALAARAAGIPFVVAAPDVDHRRRAARRRRHRDRGARRRRGARLGRRRDVTLPGHRRCATRPSTSPRPRSSPPWSPSGRRPAARRRVIAALLA